MTFKPMLAAAIDDIDKLRFPLYASPKLDGIRAIVRDGVLVSRKLKPIPNRHVQNLFGTPKLEGLDGELIVGEPNKPDVFRSTTSGVMSFDGEPDVKFMVFDYVAEGGAFSWRQDELKKRIEKVAASVVLVPQLLVCGHDELLQMEQHYLTTGYEGLILRSFDAPYKYGRSTFKEHGMLKLKRFSDSEAEVIGVVEEMFNGNEAEEDNLGRTKRSSAKAGKTGKGRMGALVVRDVSSGVEFQIGTGFTEGDRIAFWDSPPIGSVVRYKYFEIGMKDAPRHPVFTGFRSREDMS